MASDHSGKTGYGDNKSRVIKDDRGVFTITCAACGKKAVSFAAPQVIRSVVDKAFVSLISKEHFLYQGIVCSQNIAAPYVEEVKTRLEAQDLRALNTYLIQECGFDQGMDAYCVQCDRVYCREHYQIEVSFDEGFYDYTIGVCPHGHSRKIDD